MPGPVDVGKGDLIVDASKSKFQRLVSGRYYPGHPTCKNNTCNGAPFWFCRENGKYIFARDRTVSKEWVISSTLGGLSFNVGVVGDVQDPACSTFECYSHDATSPDGVFATDRNIRIIVSPTASSLVRSRATFAAPGDLDEAGHLKPEGYKYADHAYNLRRALAHLNNYDVAQHPYGISVRSMYSNLGGWYVSMGDPDSAGRPRYQHKTANIYIVYDDAARTWLFADSPNLDNSPFTFYEESEEAGAQSPTEAVWPFRTKLEAVIPPASLGDWSKAFTTSPWSTPPNAVEWVRAPQLVAPGEPAYLYNHCGPAGLLEDCYSGGNKFLSALAVVLEFPRFIEENVLLEKSLTTNGSYTFMLYDCKQRKRVPVVIDDWIPCRPQEDHASKREPFFWRTTKYELFALLLEKALAKMAGSYMAIQNPAAPAIWLALTGSTRQDFWSVRRSERIWSHKRLNDVNLVENPRDFLNIMNTRHPQNDQSCVNFRDYLADVDAEPYLSAAIIRTGEGSEIFRDDGLVNDHLYAIVQVMTVQRTDGSRADLIRLRNAFGPGHQWRGAWSANDVDNWAQLPNAGHDLRHTPSWDEGLFWMSFHDFCRVFTDIAVAPLKKDEGQRRRDRVQSDYDGTRREQSCLKRLVPGVEEGIDAKKMEMLIGA